MVNIPEFITITDKGVVLPKKEIKLVSITDPILTTPTPYFDFSKHNTIQIANDLIEAMQKFGGVGLAAPQIGYSYRVFVSGKDNNIIACFNPEILAVSAGGIILSEGCLSFMGLFLKIKRPEKVDVRYQDYNGEFHEVQLDGLHARTFQHEVDHLNGIVFTSHVGPLALKMAKEKQQKLAKQYERQMKK